LAIDIEAPGANEAELQRALSNLIEFRGAKAKMTADDTTQNVSGGDTAVSFDSAVFDTDSFWSAGAPTRLTIPATVTYVELVGQVSVASSTGDTGFYTGIFHRNSAGTLLRNFGPRLIETGGAAKQLQAVTGPVAVTAGDYFELTVREETDASVTIDGDGTGETYLAIKVIGMNPA
jgi:hypothetical protein